MPATLQLIRLFESLGHHDYKGMEALALKIVEEEESRGRIQVARKLRGALNGVGKTTQSSGSHPEETSGFLLNKALMRCPAGQPLSEIRLTPCMMITLREILAEWKNQEVLKAAGLPRRSRLLFHGPPGCGKTVTAKALACELGVPAYVVRFDSLIGAYLGQTATHLREVFQFAARTACVVLLDEIDVLGKRRGSQMDVGELDRIVVGLMQELELTSPRGLIIAASNLAAHLDAALWRRFDLQMEFKAPSRNELDAFLTKSANQKGITLSRKIRGSALKIKDYAGIERLVLDEARRKIIAKAD
jgi:ATPase family associated with various cellular activities (AAA)